MNSPHYHATTIDAPIHPAQVGKTAFSPVVIRLPRQLHERLNAEYAQMEMPRISFEHFLWEIMEVWLAERAEVPLDAV